MCYSTVNTLLDKFTGQLEQYMQHMYRCKTQYNYYKQKTESLAEKCVLVNFGRRPYPGYVENVTNAEIKVNCMHQIGEKNKTIPSFGL